MLHMKNFKQRINFHSSCRTFRSAVQFMLSFRLIYAQGIKFSLIRPKTRTCNTAYVLFKIRITVYQSNIIKNNLRKSKWILTIKHCQKGERFEFVLPILIRPVERHGKSICECGTQDSRQEVLDFLPAESFQKINL